MTIEAETAAARTTFQDKVYHFCSSRCKDKFLEHPDWYVSVRTGDSP